MFRPGKIQREKNKRIDEIGFACREAAKTALLVEG
jgi:hypothetical protein